MSSHHWMDKTETTVAEQHEIERRGCKIICERLAAVGGTVKKSDDRTFDLIVDGEYAEVKAKGNGWDRFGFISLTKAQRQALGKKLKAIFLVLNVNHPKKVEVIEIRAEDLLKCECQEILRYDWKKTAIRHLRRQQ